MLLGIGVISEEILSNHFKEVGIFVDSFNCDNTIVKGNQLTYFNKMWNYIEPWIDRRQYAFVTFSILIGLWLSFSSITTHKVSSISDLITVEGILSKYSFVDGERGTKKYYIWLTQHEATFQIPADFLNFFEKDKFEKTINAGQKIYVGISRSDKASLTKINDRIRIYELHNDYASYLKSSLTIKQENNTLQYIIGPLFILAGVFFFFYRRKKLRHDYG